MTSHECGPWSFIQQYDVVPHMLWLNESDLQRIAVMFDEIWLETVIGAIRRTVVLNICQGRCCWSRDRDWKIRVATRERCSDAANQAIIRWSSLMAPSAHLRLTGEAASWLRLGVLPPVRGGHTQVQAVLQELTPPHLDFGGLGRLSLEAAVEIDCPLEPVDANAWWPVHVREHKSARLLSLNVGPVGLKHSLRTLHHIIRANNPSVILI